MKGPKDSPIAVASVLWTSQRASITESTLNGDARTAAVADGCASCRRSRRTGDTQCMEEGSPQRFVSTERLGPPRGIAAGVLGVSRRAAGDAPTATCHLQVREEENAICGYEWEGLTRVPGAPRWADLHPELRCDACSAVLGIQDQDPKGGSYPFSLFPFMSSTTSGRFAAFMNSSKVVSWLLVAVSFGCLFGGVVAYQNAVALRDHGARAIGSVIAVEDTRRDSYVVVRFTTNGGSEVTAEVGNYLWDPSPQVGDEANLLYDRNDPTGNVADVRMGPDFFSVWALLAGALLAGALVWPTRSGRLDWNRLR